jgi:arabinogalactan oligomer/maltooligosaccharide transport system substrate-binding protein
VQEEAMSILAERDPVLGPYVDQCRTGLIMPLRPEMREAWQLLGRTEYQVLAGDGDPRALAEAAARAGWELLDPVRGAG